MEQSVTHQSFPRGALLGAALLVGFSLCAATAARLMHVNATPLPAAQAVRVLHLTFRDRSDGGVEILDAARGNTQITELLPGTNGFVRGVLRGLARERRRESIGALPPFSLTRWSDGRMTLDDPQTGQHVNLEVFGPANARPFADIFAADAALARNPGP
jgi:putative photosynthetic complex assembly protein